MPPSSKCLWSRRTTKAGAINYNTYLKQFFGDRERLDEYLGVTLQFAQLEVEEFGQPNATTLPKCLAAYLTDFDNTLSESEFNSR